MSWIWKKPWLPLLACMLLLTAKAAAAEPVPCFAPGAFAGEALPEGIWITEVPRQGQVRLGQRVIRPGDVIPADRLGELVYLSPDSTHSARLGYLPVYPEGIGAEAVLVISLPGRENQPPQAENTTRETYRNLPCEGLLPVTDPEQESMTFTLTRKPRRGEVIFRSDGSFLYTPEKNKVGTDSFCFTATDPEGNVSQEATVIIQILKPADSLLYADTQGLPCRFEAEWLRNTGIFAGEQIGDQLCFSPEEPVSRGTFLVMVMETLGLPPDGSATETADCPGWLAPYLTAARRAGIVPEEASSDWSQPISGSSARALIRSALAFSAPAALTRESSSVWSPDDPGRNPGSLLPERAIPVTRAHAANALYRLHLLARGRL